MNRRAGLDWSREREKSMTRQHNLSKKCLSIICWLRSHYNTGVCSLCMIRVNGRSILGLLAGMMNP